MLRTNSVWVLGELPELVQERAAGSAHPCCSLAVPCLLHLCKDVCVSAQFLPRNQPGASVGVSSMCPDTFSPPPSDTTSLLSQKITCLGHFQTHAGVCCGDVATSVGQDLAGGTRTSFRV